MFNIGLEDGLERGRVCRTPPTQQQTQRSQLFRNRHTLTTDDKAGIQLLGFGFFVVISMTPLAPRMP